MKKVLLGSALLLSVAATPVLAGPHWDQVAISYLSADFDGEDVSGFGLVGTKLINPNIFVGGIYSGLSEDIGNGVDLSLNSLSLGVGMRKAVSATTDIFGAISYENAEVEFSGSSGSISDDANGYGIRAGVRSMVTPMLELSADLGFVDIEDETDTSFAVGADYRVTNQFAAGGSFVTTGEVDTFSLGVVFKF
jgi:hypothetical protein